MSLRAPKALIRTEITGAAISSARVQAAMVQRDGQLQWRAPKRTELSACGCDVRLTRDFRPGGSARQRVQGRRPRPAGVPLDPSATYSELQFGEVGLVGLCRSLGLAGPGHIVAVLIGRSIVLPLCRAPGVRGVLGIVLD